VSSRIVSGMAHGINKVGQLTALLYASEHGGQKSNGQMNNYVSHAYNIGLVTINLILS